MRTVLVVDDEQSVRDSLRMILEYEKFNVLFAENGPRCLGELGKNVVDAVLLDIKMPGMDGMEVLREIRERYPGLPVIMISGHGTIETAVEAAKTGAFDFLQKPLDRDRILITIRNALEQKKLTSEVQQIRQRIEGKEQILGETSGIKEILALVERVAPTESRVLIMGENGTGKELVAKAIHRKSKRRDKTLVEVNCAAIPKELIESELFGHEKGAFTGATVQRIGKFEQADGGTIFLDEIGDMSLEAQAKVLRALEEGRFERVGGSKTISSDVRVIAATNKSLPDEIERGNFREDLYHRLNVIPIHVPPLRERREDIPILVKAFVEDICLRNGMAIKTISERTTNILMSMEWRGNVRELRNMVERLVIITPGNDIDAAMLESVRSDRKNELDDIITGSKTFQEFKDRAEAAYIQHMLELNNWNISRTAEGMDIQRSHLYSKMKKYGLERAE